MLLENSKIRNTLATLLEEKYCIAELLPSLHTGRNTVDHIPSTVFTARATLCYSSSF